MHPPSSCRAWQLQAHRPRRIPRFIASIHNRRIHSQRLLPSRSPPHAWFRIRILRGVSILPKEPMHRFIPPIFTRYPPICLLHPLNLLKMIPLMNMSKSVHQRLRRTQGAEEMRAPYAAIVTTVPDSLRRAMCHADVRMGAVAEREPKRSSFWGYANVLKSGRRNGGARRLLVSAPGKAGFCS